MSARDINNLIETRDKPVTYPHFKMALPFDVPLAFIRSLIQQQQRNELSPALP